MKLSATLSFLVLFSLNLFAQPQTGSLMIGGNLIGAQHHYFRTGGIDNNIRQEVNLNLRFGYFLWKASVFGADFSVYRMDFAKETDYFERTEFTVFYRQYFNPHKLRSFISIENVYQNTENETWDEFNFSNGRNMKYWSGGGFNYFLNENIALEAVFLWKFYDRVAKNSSSDWNRKWKAKVDIQYFFGRVLNPWI